VPSDVHEVDVRCIEEEVIVKRRHLEAGVERSAHRRIHLVFEQYEVTHHGNVAAHANRRRERRVRGQPHERRHGAPIVDRDRHVCPAGTTP
jgi:hypothetical protein